MKPSYLIILLVMNLCCAAVYSVYKVVGQVLPTGAIVTLRFGMAGLCLLFAWPWLPGPAPRGKDLAVTFFMGALLYVLGQRLQVYGNQIGTAGNSAVLMAFEPLTVSLAAGIFLREHIGPRRLGGFALALCGVGLLHGVWRPDFQWTSLAASMIFISSFVCEAIYSVLGKPIVQRSSVMKMLSISLLFGSGLNLLIDGRQTLDAAKALSSGGWALLIALAVICTAIGYSIWFIVIRECPINVAALTIFTQSAFGVALAGLWLGEKLHWEQFAGCITITGGLILGLSRQVTRTTPAPASEPHGY